MRDADKIDELTESTPPLSVKQNMAWNSIGSLVNLGCQWLITILIVRLGNGYEAAGVYSLATSVYGIFSPVGQYRMKTYQVSDVKGENTTGEYLAFRYITIAASLLLCFAYSALSCPSYALPAIMLYGVFKSVSLVIEVLHACDQQHGRMDYVGQSLALQGVISFTVFVGLFMVTGNLELTLLAMSVSVAIVGLMLDAPRTLRFDSLLPRIGRDKVFRLLRVCLPAVAAGIAASAAPSLPRQYLSLAMGSESLGIYSSIAAPIAIIQMGASYVYGPLLTYFSLHYARGEKKDFLELLKKAVLGIVGIGAICTVAIILLGEPLLVLLYGESIHSYTSLMIPMIPFAVLTGGMWFINDLSMSLRSFRGSFWGGISSLVCAVTVMVPMVSMYGMNGVTFTGLLSCLVSVLVMSIFLFRKIGGLGH
ncbi:hypothetical protein [Thermophilibacter sp.]|uniref:hypothetical protein n=1 Tax=Thermophilibacter sp. TaxID=2847309 RepID=UPI003A8CCEEA